MITEICKSFGGAAVGGTVVYLPCTDGVRAVRVDGAGPVYVLWHASGSVTGSPVIGGGRIWALDTTAGVLHALDPATGTSLGQVDVGVANRFATPALYGADGSSRLWPASPSCVPHNMYGPARVILRRGSR